MKNKTTKRVLSCVLAFSILATVGIGAYLTDTDVKEDVYTIGNVQAEIVSLGDMQIDNVGALLPGTVHQYERAAKNTGINDAYVFLTLTIPYEIVGVSNDDGTQLGEQVRQLFMPGTINSEWKLVDAGYIGQYEIVSNGQNAGEHDKYSAAVGDTITYIYGYIGDNADGSLKALASGETTANLVETMKLTNLYHIDKIDGEISTKLYAIQNDYVNGGLTDVNGVWAVINSALVGNEDKVAESHTLMAGPKMYKFINGLQTDFKANITSAEFVAGKPAPANATDVSEAQDGSIMAWFEGSTYYVSAVDGGKIVANADSSYLLYRFPNLKSVNLDNVDFSNVTNSDNMFNQSGLTSFVVPNELTVIGTNTFNENDYLTTVTIHENVTLLDQYAFYGCGRLQTINYTGTEEQWNAIVKAHGWNSGVPSSCVINFNYVP